MNNKEKALQKFVFKIHSTRLRKASWNLKLSIPEAMKNQEIIPLADSTTLRFIDEINHLKEPEAKAHLIKSEIKRLKQQDNARGNRKKITALYEELHELQFKKDYLCLIIDKESDYWRAFHKGFQVNGITYSRLLATTGGVKSSTIVFINNEIKPELHRRFENGRNPLIPMVPAKFGAYEALNCSSSIPVSDPTGILVVKDCITNFTEDIIKIDDSDLEEPSLQHIKDFPIEKIVSDGFGLMLPSIAERWGEELGLDYLPSGFNTRAYAYCKGMLVTFDFVAFAKEIAKSYFVKDAWGNEVDIRTVDVILTTSMLKLWDSYDSFASYFQHCKENHYQFCITKVCPKELEQERNLNYQFLQSYDMTEEELMELIRPTIDEIHGILGADYRQSLLYLKGTQLSEENAWFGSADYIKALMVNKKMIDDPYVRTCIFRLIKKKIDSAKVGVIKVNGNFQFSCGDPYALAQSIFNLPVTGLLKKGEFYSRYWCDKNTKEVICFRAPMTCHNNIQKITFSNTEDINHWYQYIKTMLIFNAWDTATDALNGQDHDGDQNLLTDNPILLKKHRKLPTIMCIQRKAPKIIFTDEDLVQANINSFGDNIGTYTNGITSQFNVQAQFHKESPEYNELEYRIMCGQLFQQNAIDKTKGILAKPRPKNWFDFSSNRILDEDNIQEINKKEFYKSITADKKPYFMQYIYPQTKAIYTKYIKDTNKKCQIEFNIDFETLLKKADPSSQESEFIKYYYLRMPVGIHDCIVNQICLIFEKEFDHYISKYNSGADFDYQILKSDKTYTPAQYKGIEQIYKTYCSTISNYQQRIKRERILTETAKDEKQTMLHHFIQECEILCPDTDKLTNIVLDLCYQTNNSKQFAWDICKDTILSNLLKQSDNRISFPVASLDGDITFNGNSFKMTRIQIGETENESNIK